MKNILMLISQLTVVLIGALVLVQKFYEGFLSYLPDKVSWILSCVFFVLIVSGFTVHFIGLYLSER